MSQLYKTMHHTNENTTNYQVSPPYSQKVNNACTGTPITIEFQEHRMKIIYPPYVTSFYALHKNDKKETDIEGEEMIYAIIYLENS